MDTNFFNRERAEAEEKAAKEIQFIPSEKLHEHLTKGQQICEACSWMKLKGVRQFVIDEFEKNNKIIVSDQENFKFTELSEIEQQLIKKFEEKHDCIVFHVTRKKIKGMRTMTYLFVPAEKEEVLENREDYNSDILMVYVQNIDIPDYSEFGTSYIVVINGVVFKMSYTEWECYRKNKSNSKQ